MIHLIGVPFDLCGRRPGSRLGPAALRLAGLVETLTQLGLTVEDLGDLHVLPEAESSDGLRNFGPLTACLTNLQQQAQESMEAGAIPIVVGGDHSVAMGGISAALAQTRGDLAVLWIDAHADLNTPCTSDSGNLHGMPLAALMGTTCQADGLRKVQWDELLRRLGEPRLPANCTAWIGLRDVDLGERKRIREATECYAATMYDVDRHGLPTVVQRFDAWMRKSGATRLWISFDVDVLDPILAPGTGTAVRGGLSYREGHLMAEMLREMLDAPDCPYRLAGVDLVETNPVVDSNNETAKVAVEWMASLFGKTILGGTGA